MYEDYLMHEGKGHEDGGHSGRYPWGSGDNPYQHWVGLQDYPFLFQWKGCKAYGMSDKEAADALGMTVAEAHKKRMREEEEFQRARDNRIVKMRDEGKSKTDIAKALGVEESTIRSRLKKIDEPKEKSLRATVDILKEELKTKKAIDVGTGVERELGISKERLAAAVDILADEGYISYPTEIKIQQATGGPGKRTTMNILAQPGVTTSDIYRDPTIVEPVMAYSPDQGQHWAKREYPASIDSSRVFIRYGDEGGNEKDGTIEIRPGVPDLSLGKSTYAQVRIAVDDKQYMKGMAFYSDEVPKGYDCVYNVHYNRGEKIFKSFKKNAAGEVDRNNPFGAFIKANGQSWYDDPVTGEKKLSAVNKLKEEGDWDVQSRNLASQFLGKQPMALIKSQLTASLEKSKNEYNDIKAIDNPTIRKKMLWDFASSCDEAAEELKAAAFPRQSTKVILPLTCMKDNEIYAPSYNNGEHLCLVRYPHGGTFEIPELVVNNKKKARDLLGNATDAVGININVAARLSGADFDGDTVVCIPVNDKVRVKTSDPLPGLRDFTTDKYSTGKGEGETMTERQKGLEMGKISNLITDMTLKGANRDEIERAVRHSMVVIDAYKHGLDWKQSEADNNIKELKELYQPETKQHGASTLLSRASAEINVPETAIPSARDVDPETGRLIPRYTNRKYKDQKKIKDPDTGEVIDYVDTGKMKYATEKTSRMKTVDDAFDLVSTARTEQEVAYALFANTMKAMANNARKEYLQINDYKVDDKAKARYADEVDSLNRKLALAEMNAPRERQAQRIANIRIKALRHDHPELKLPEYKDKYGKYKDQILQDARFSVGSSKKKVLIEPSAKEWEAIQAHAISYTKLNKLMTNMKPDTLRELSMPKQEKAIPKSKQNAIASFAARGYTQAEIADALNVSTATVSKYMKGDSNVQE